MKHRNSRTQAKPASPTPVRDETMVSQPLADKKARDAAFRRLMAKLKKGYPLGIKKFIREEAYERDGK
jgi:hypothetical protein